MFKENEANDKVWDNFWTDSKNHDYWIKPDKNVINFIAKLPNDKSYSILDLGCGLGRHSIYCSKLGYSVLAIDNSSEAVQHLIKWASKEDCKIKTLCCEIDSNELNEKLFDIVISYNVIYHGFQGDFKKAISRIYDLLNPNGQFFFTCPTRKDGKFGIGEKLDEHTYKCLKSVTPGDIHYFTDKDELTLMLSNFNKIEISIDEGTWINSGEEQFYSNFIVIAKK